MYQTRIQDTSGTWICRGTCKCSPTRVRDESTSSNLCIPGVTDRMATGASSVSTKAQMKSGIVVIPTSRRQDATTYDTYGGLAVEEESLRQCRDGSIFS